MRRFIVAGFFVSLILFPLFVATYLRGMADGVERYRHSKQFMLTLYSMYMFGLKDGCTDDAMCDKAGLGGGNDEAGRR
jgi:hypothetical protein